MTSELDLILTLNLNLEVELIQHKLLIIEGDFGFQMLKMILNHNISEFMMNSESRNIILFMVFAFSVLALFIWFLLYISL